MKIRSMDHLVITTRNPEQCIDFYAGLLGMTLDTTGGRYAFRFGAQKFNVHTRPAEFLPAAQYPTAGSLDICLEVEGNLTDVKREIERAGYPVEWGIVERNGARGPMKSLYLRDPDGNLVELCSYD